MSIGTGAFDLMYDFGKKVKSTSNGKINKGTKKKKSNKA